MTTKSNTQKKSNAVIISDRVDTTKALMYVIGDVQGQLTSLTTMLGKILDSSTNNNGLLAKNDRVIILGNFLNALGDPPREILECLKEYKTLLRERLVIIRGSTEHALLQGKATVLRGPLGVNLVNSYRTGTGKKPFSISSIENIKYKKGLDQQAMLEDLAWLKENTTEFYEGDKFFVCGSGINPVQPLDKQILQSLMFIRHAFMTHKEKFEKIIVHGTTPTNKKRKVDIRSNRINVNTNPNSTGILSCVVLDDTKGTVVECLTSKALKKI